MENLGAVLQ
uniref:Uncharacterized protein n=1 Tax=Anguilla anguilla TaxID=7936 RepID=A0A0E9SPU5_ANGAN